MIIKSLDGAIFLKNTDTATDMKLQVLEADDITPVDLTDKIVEVIIGTDAGRVLVKEPTYQNELGHVHFGLDNGDLIPNGDYHLEIHISEGLEKRVAPSRGFYKLRVSRSIDEAQVEVTTFTLDYFLNEVRLSTLGVKELVEEGTRVTNETREVKELAEIALAESVLAKQTSGEALSLAQETYQGVLGTRDIAYDIIERTNEANTLANETILATESTRLATEEARSITIQTTNSAIETVEDLTGQVERKLVDTDSAIVATKEATTDAKSATIEANNARDSALAQGDYAKLQGDFAKEQTVAASLATSSANEASRYAESSANSTIAATQESITVRNATQQVKDDTETVKQETLVVKADTLAIKLDTEKVKSDTLALKNATETVKNTTQEVQNKTEAVRVATEKVRVDTEAVRVATDKVRSETDAVKQAAQEERLRIAKQQTDFESTVNTRVNAFGQVVDDANAKSTDALDKSTVAKKVSEDVQTQFNRIVAETGDSTPEITQARDGHASLSVRLKGVDTKLEDVERELFGITKIPIEHRLDDFPTVHAVVIDGFGLNKFGFGSFGGGERHSTNSRVEYIDSNNLIVFIPESFKGTPSVITNGLMHTATFPGTDAQAEIYVRGNH